MIMIKLESSWSCLVDLKGLLILINYNIEEKQAICNYLRSLCTKKKLIIIVMSLNEDETNRPRKEAVYFLSWIKQSVWFFLCFCLVFLFGSFNKVFKVASVLNSKLINSLFVSFFRWSMPATKPIRGRLKPDGTVDPHHRKLHQITTLWLFLWKWSFFSINIYFPWAMCPW